MSILAIVWIICGCLNVVSIGFQNEEEDFSNVLFGFVIGPVYSLFLLGTLIRCIRHRK